MAKGWGIILHAIVAWVALGLFAVGFAAFMTIGISCTPWQVAWRNHAGPEAGPACPLTPDPWAKPNTTHP